MILCSKCGFENQLGHIFCTRCRARLDLRHVSEQDLVNTKKPGGRKWFRIMLALDFLIVVAIALAFYPLPIEVRRGTTSVDLQQARRKLAMMEKGIPMSAQVFTESEVNACLAVDLEARRKTDAFELRSVHVKLKPNAVVLSATATWAPTLAGGVRIGPFDITYGMTGVPEIGDEGFHFAVSGGMIGHLPLPGPLSLVVAPQIKAYFRSLRRNYPVMGAVQRFELEEGKVTVFLAK